MVGTNISSQGWERRHSKAAKPLLTVCQWGPKWTAVKLSVPCTAMGGSKAIAMFSSTIS